LTRRLTTVGETGVPGLYAAGVAAVVLALGIAASSGLGLPEAALLVAGCDLLVVALATGARRVSPTGARPVSPTNACSVSPTGAAGSGLTALLSGAIADGVMLFAMGAAALIVVFGQSKPIERLGYFLAILVLVPLCVTLAWRRRRTSTDERQRFVAFASLAATAVSLCLARSIAFPSTAAVGKSLFLLLELVAARTAIALSARVMPATWMRRLSAPAAIAGAPLLLAVSAGAFIPAATFSVLDIAVPFVAALIAFLLMQARVGHGGLPRVGVHATDAAVLTVASLVLFYVAGPEGELAENHNYFLGPALAVLHGHPMLVSTFSQYGVGMIYALAAVFLVIPIGYGTFTLLLSCLTVLFFGVFYVILRWSTRSVLVAVIGLASVVVLDMFGQIAFYSHFPSTGVLRFGLPWLLILCSLAAARTTRRRRLFDGLTFAIVAVAAIWSGETCGYCLGTACALACFNAAIADGSVRDRIRRGTRNVALLVGVAASSVLAFTLVMRLATGVWPDWGGYLEFLHLYTIEDFGDLPIEPWSPGLAIGAMYAISAIAIVLLVLSRPELVRERAVAFRAAAGLTALGVLVYTYFLGRSHPNNVIHVSPPAIVLLFVWFDIFRSTFDSRKAVAVAGATTVFFGAMIVTSQTKNFGLKYGSTALASVLGSSAPLESRVQALWRNPVVSPATVEVIEFVESLQQKHTSLTLLLSPNITTEVLMRLGLANAVGSSNPAQESIAPGAAARIAAAVRSLRPGGILVFSEVESALTIEQYALELLRARFAFREIGRDGQGLRAFIMAAKP